jgi:hypothetical protein
MAEGKRFTLTSFKKAAELATSFGGLGKQFKMSPAQAENFCRKQGIKPRFTKAQKKRNNAQQQ